MKSWYLVRGYSKYLVKAEIKKVKFTSKKRNTKKDKSLEAVPFVLTYHPKLKSMNKFILKYLDLLYIDKEVKKVFTHYTHDFILKCKKAKQLFSKS